MLVVDSHHHLWDWDVWETPDFPPSMEVLRASYLPQDYKKEIDAVGVTSSVLVGGYPLSFSQHQWYFDVADDCPFIAGVVGWIDMLRPEAAASQLDELQEKPKFVGIRHILDMESDPDWAREASPVAHMGEFLPATLILYADGDWPSLRRQSQLLGQALEARGSRVETRVVEGEDHYTIVPTLSRDDRPAGEAILDFVTHTVCER